LDPLSASIAEIAPRIASPTLRAFQSPWARQTAAGSRYVHFVLSGVCRIWTERGSQSLGPRALVLACSGTPHVLSSLGQESPEVTPWESSPSLPLSAWNPRTTAAGVELLSASLQLASRSAHPVWDCLPDFVVVHADQVPLPRSYEATLTGLYAEASHPKGGSDFILAHLFEVLVAQALRVHVSEVAYDDRGWFRALADPALSPALQLLHAESVERLDVGHLGAEANRSPDRFSARFAQLSGLRPRDFLSLARVQRAAALIDQGRSCLHEIATAAGFSSVPSLCRAFRRELGCTPAAYWRRRHERRFPKSGRKGSAAKERSDSETAGPEA
jgi:AraC-like DNA-binding protein